MKANPLFSNIETNGIYTSSDCATYSGISIKTFILLAISIVVGIFTATALPTILQNNPAGLYGALIISSIVGTICVFAGRTSNKAAKYCSIIYAACEGLFLGTITALFESMYRGIATIAVVGTVTVFATMLLLYANGILRVGDRMRRFLWTLIIGALALTLVTSLLSLTGILYNINPGFIVLLDAFFLFYGAITLLVNFDEASRVVESGCDKNAEWKVSLGLAVSVIYIYVQILRLAYYLYRIYGDR